MSNDIQIIVALSKPQTNFTKKSSWLDTSAMVLKS